MKVSVAALAVLIAAFCSQASAAGPQALNTPSVCCYKYSLNPISRSRVVKYEYTSSDCSKPAVIFTTIKGKTLCTNPDEKWVQRIVTQLRTREAVSMAP
ncbi:C-C motif chemokine 3-like [Gopherus flavomarginatus]|uniref:C-C motif chemokine 3-like n=1 Tax=Gopherus flavomarginatus TaxID=286002 RepID=UPI0021CC3B75|nr:C-C motif chemokine 3-like [Gopherus flavomarginatus]